MKKLVLLFFSLFCILSVFADTYMVTANSLNVRNAPSVKGSVIGKVTKGQELEVKEVKSGFAVFDFQGGQGYASVKYLKKIASSAPAEAAPAEVDEPVEEINVDWASDSHATVYVFYDLKNYIASMPVTVNGDITFCMEGEPTESKLYGTRYTPSMRKLNVTGEGRMYMSLDFTFGDKPWHSDLTLDIADGGVYYVKIHVENLWNGITKKRMGIYLKQLKPKDGLKELKKDKYTVNPEVDIIL